MGGEDEEERLGPGGQAILVNTPYARHHHRVDHSVDHQEEVHPPSASPRASPSFRTSAGPAPCRAPLPPAFSAISDAQGFFVYQLPPPSDTPAWPLPPLPLLRRVLQNSIIDTTQAWYAAGIQQFIDWLYYAGGSADDLRGSSEQILCHYVATLCGRISGKTIRNHISAIKTWQTVNGYVAEHGPVLSQALQAAERLTPFSSMQGKRPPLEVKTLVMIMAELSQ